PALIGPLLGPFLGGLIVHWAHWRVIFLMNLPFGLLGLWLSRSIMPDYRDEHVPPLDRLGFLLFGAGTALLSYVLEVFGEHSLPGGAVLGLLALSLALLALYAAHSRRVRAPLLALGLFRLRTLRISVLGGLLTRLGVGGMPFLLPLLYQIGLGYAPWEAGLLTMPSAAAAIAMRVLNRRILARFGHRQTLLVNTVLLGMTIAAFTQVSPDTPIGVIVLLGFAQGFFSSLQFTSLNTLVVADIDDRDASHATTISSAGQQLSMSFGVAAASLAVAAFLGPVNQKDPTQAIPALHKAFAWMGGATLLSSLLFLLLRRTDGGNVSRFGAPSAAEGA
ncbi:MAG: MFS transporter, partial [Planctomycetaceae bacterium]|nr:MFS transporter [Planctomycetaceae bacterium]